MDRCRVHDGANRHVLRGDFVSNEIRVCERERRPGEYVHVAGTDSRCKLARVRRRVFSDCADGWYVHFVGQIRRARRDAELGREFGDGYEWMDWKCI